LYAEKRRAEAARIREKYPDRIPVRTCNFFSFAIVVQFVVMSEVYIYGRSRLVLLSVFFWLRSLFFFNIWGGESLFAIKYSNVFFLF